MATKSGLSQRAATAATISRNNRNSVVTRLRGPTNDANMLPSSMWAVVLSFLDSTSAMTLTTISNLFLEEQVNIYD